MAETVDDIRNEIRETVGRYERIESTAFTKEALAAICEAVGYEIDQNNYPPKPEMRAGILCEIGVLDDPDPSETSTAFRKSELEAIRDTLTDN